MSETRQGYGSRLGQTSTDGEFDMPNIFNRAGSTLNKVRKQDFYAISNTNKRFMIDHDSTGISSRQNIS